MSDNLLDVQIRHSLQSANGRIPMEISLNFPKSSITVVTGQSGAGKTTLLRQIAGLVTPESGTISFLNNIWLDTSNGIQLPVQQRNIGFVFQDYALFPHLTIKQNLQYALTKNADPSIINELLESTGLLQLADRRPFQLSGGQQQRLALARALVRKPDLLLLDEPFNALDRDMRIQLQNLLLAFYRKHGFSIILVTHDISEIFRLADRVVIMENGKVISSGTPSEVYLNQDIPAGDFLLYGEVLSVEKEIDRLIIHALIENKMRTLQLPVTIESEIIPGQRFALRYSLDSPEIHFIKRTL